MSEPRTTAQVAGQEQPYPDVRLIDRHDAARLAQFSDLLSDAQCVSLEGEPIYADRGWDQFHAFTHDAVIPELTDMLAGSERRLDVLYDDCTVASTPFSLGYYIEHIERTRSDQLPIRVSTESDMLDRARDWVAQLQANGQTSQNDGVTRLDGEKTVTLTTKGGRPTCAVLDAVYQIQKAESGIDTAVLVHNTNFRGQQLDMQAVLRAVNGSMVFNNFANVYVRQRKGALRIAAIQVLSTTAELTEIK